MQPSNPEAQGPFFDRPAIAQVTAKPLSMLQQMFSDPQVPLSQSHSPGPPPLPPNNEMYDYALTSLMEVLRRLVNYDSSSLLYVFPTKARNNPQAGPIRPRAWQEQGPDRSTLEIYAHQIWLRIGNRPTLRFLLGHDKPHDELFCPALQTDLEVRDCSLAVDHIQAATIVTCGFLVGSYMRSFNVDH